MLLLIGGYRTARLMAVPGGWDYYEVVFDKNNIAISQKITTQDVSLTLHLPVTA